MRRIKLYALGLCLLAMTSCNSDGKEFLNVGKEGKADVECSELDQLVEIPIESSGNWVASLPENCDWVTVLTPEGSNGTLRLVVDMNKVSEGYIPVKRTTTVTVKCSDQTSIIELTQLASSRESNSEESTLSLNKGVGSGFNLLNNESKAQIFNVNTIADFNEDDEIRETFKVSPISSGSVAIYEFDSLESKKDTLGVKLSVNVSYGCFKVKISGEYNSYEKKESNNFKYGQVAMLPRAASKLEVLDLVAKYEENEEKRVTSDAGYSKSMEGIFAAGFKRVFRIVKDAYAKKGKDSKEFKDGVATLVGGYGSVVVTGATLGGQVSMNVQADTTEVTDVTNIKGKATVAIRSMVSIEANVDVKYSKEGTELLKKSLINSYVQGGSGEAISVLSNALQSAPVEMSSAKIHEAVLEWEKTVVYDKNQDINKTEVIEYVFTGIWNLFPYNMAADVRSVILEFYKGKEAMLDIEKLQLSKSTNKTPNRF